MSERPTDNSAVLDRVNRRSFLGCSGVGVGAAALGALLQRDLVGAAASASSVKQLGLPGLPHHPPRAKRVIFLCMAGGPSQFETFDNKPRLHALHGQPMPPSVTAGQPIAQLQGQELVVQRPLYKFHCHGRSGQEVSELFPRIGSVADEICIVRSLHTEQINHDPAHMFMNTGTAISGRPSMGSWIWYGLGSEASDLPGFVVLTSLGGRSPQPLSTRQWHSGFLPSRFQGVKFRSRGEAVHYLRSPDGVGMARQRDVVDAVQQLDRLAGADAPGAADFIDDPDLASRIAQYELAFKMQMSVPKLMDISDEPKRVLDLYGCERPDGSFAYNCLIARRMAERGVRFIQLYHRDWDHHDHLDRYMRICAGLCDGPTAALITDLKQRGMLDETLLVWGGEFGRTPMAQTNKGDVGRDHHMRAFSMFLCGGGVRGGITHGSTDDLGYHVADKPVHVHDLHATMLHLLGIDHLRLTVRQQGRDFRLTDVAGQVVREILA